MWAFLSRRLRTWVLLAIAGGIESERFMDSASTDVRGLIAARQFCSRKGFSSAICCSNSPDEAPRSGTSCQTVAAAAAGDAGVSQGASE